MEKTSSLKDKTARGFFWGALNNGAMQVLNAVFGIVLARKLDQDDYGLIGMLTIFTLIANSLQDSGFVTALTNKKDATRHDYSAVFWFNIGVSLCLYILLFFCAPLIAWFFNEPILTNLSRYYFFGFFIASFSIVPRAILFRQIRQKELAIMGLCSLLVSGIVGIAMAYNGMAYWGLATQTIVFNLMVSILSWVFAVKAPLSSPQGGRNHAGCLSSEISPLKTSPDGILPPWGDKRGALTFFAPIREMFPFSCKMLITNIFISVNNNIFSVVLGKLYNKYEVGTYNQANKWNTMGASTITGMVQGVAQPAFVEVGDDIERLRRVFSKMLRFTCFVSFPIMFGLALVAPEFIVTLIKEKWLSSAHLMQYLCIGGAFLPIATLYYNLIISRGKSDVYMWNIIAQGCAILGSILMVHASGIRNLDFSLFTLHFSLQNLDLMVIAYACIVILWIGIWHIFLYQEIRYPFLSALKDILPFLLIAATAIGVTYFATLGIENRILLLICRIPMVAVLYLGMLKLFGAQILRECWGYLLKKK